MAVQFYQYVIAGDASLDKVKAAISCPKKDDELDRRYSATRARKPSLMAHFDDEHDAQDDDDEALDALRNGKRGRCEKCDGILELTELETNNA